MFCLKKLINQLPNFTQINHTLTQWNERLFESKLSFSMTIVNSNDLGQVWFKSISCLRKKSSFPNTKDTQLTTRSIFTKSPPKCRHL